MHDEGRIMMAGVWMTVLAVALGQAGTDVRPAVDAGTLFINANEAYTEGAYADAVVFYKKAIDVSDNFASGYLWYNLGNAQLRQGALGEAIASYLRAQHLLPRHADIAANLAFARKSTKDALDPIVPSPILRTLFFWHFILSKAELFKGLICCNGLLFLLLGAQLFFRDSEWIRFGAWFFVFLTLVLGLSTIWRYAAPRRIAVVRSVEVEVHSGTAEDTLVLFKLHAGAEMKWIEQQGDWLRISIDAQRQGWVAAQSVVPLLL